MLLDIPLDNDVFVRVREQRGRRHCAPYVVDDALFIQQDRKLFDQLLLAAVEHRDMLDLHGRPVGASGDLRRVPLGLLELLNTSRKLVQILSKQLDDLDTLPVEESVH